jgi:hypothetical protein
MLHSVDDKRRINVSKEKVRGKTKREEVIYQEVHHTSFWTRGLKVIQKRKEELPEGREYMAQVHL